MEPLVEQTETKDISAIQQQRLLTYEEAMEVIKDATGVSGIQGVVRRFLTQGWFFCHITLHASMYVVRMILL